MNFKPGWRSDLEDRAYLVSASRPFTVRATAEMPEHWSHRSWLAIEDQMQQGACSGHAVTSDLEVCEHIATGGNVVQLNRQFSYVRGQIPDGIRGDQGATISGVVKAAMTDGVCRESLSPYTGRYYTQFPQACFEEAKQHLLRSMVKIRSHEQAVTFLRSGTGAIIFGTSCVRSIMDTRGVIESLSGGSAGGHAMAWVSCTERKDSRGRNYLDMPQSWGRSYGDNGWAEWAPSCVDQVCRDPNSEVIGVSDLERFGEIRNPSFVGMSG